MSSPVAALSSVDCDGSAVVLSPSIITATSPDTRTRPPRCLLSLIAITWADQRVARSTSRAKPAASVRYNTATN